MWRAENVLLLALVVAVIVVAVLELRDGGLDRPGSVTPTTAGEMLGS